MEIVTTRGEYNAFFGTQPPADFDYSKDYIGEFNAQQKQVSKTPKNVKASNYTKKPKDLMKVKIGNKTMLGRQQDLLCLIFEFDKGSFFASNKHLAEMFGVDPQTITNDISKLRKAGFLDYHSYYDKVTGKTYKRTLRVSGEVRAMFEGMEI